MHYTKVPDKSSSPILSQLLRFGKKGKAGLGGRGGGLGGFFVTAMSLSREQRSWMVTQSWGGEQTKAEEVWRVTVDRRSRSFCDICGA